MDLFVDVFLILLDVDLCYFLYWLDVLLVSVWLLCLEQEMFWEQLILCIYGEEYLILCLVVWYGDLEVVYCYFGQVYWLLLWIVLFGEICECVECEVGQWVNGVLLNYYCDGQDFMGWYSDDELELCCDLLVVLFSFGGSCCFDLWCKGQICIVYFLELIYGSLLVMCGVIQYYW